MTQPEGAPATGGAPPAGTGQQQPQGQPAPKPEAPQRDALEDHDDGLFDVKDGDAPWIRRLRTQGAGYRTRARETAAERDDYKAKYEKLVGEVEQQKQSAVASRREAIAKQHGLWDSEANGGKGGLLPGIDLGSGTEDEMTAVAKGISTKFRGGGGGAARRPVTIAGETSGTSAESRSGTGKAAAAIRELMRGRETSSG